MKLTLLFVRIISMLIKLIHFEWGLTSVILLPYSKSYKAITY